MNRPFWTMLLALISSPAFSLTDPCGIEWTTHMSRRMGVSPARVVNVANAIEVGPNHWVSNDPKGGIIYINFGHDVGEAFARKSSRNFQWKNALVDKELLDQWKADSSPFAFRYKIDVAWSARALPSAQGIHQFKPAQRNLAAPMELGCRGGSPWTDADGRNWRTEILNAKGNDFFQAWLNKWSMRPDKVVQAPNPNQWFPISDGYTVDFDPAFCDTHLGAAIQFSYWREFYLDDWKFDIYETTDPNAVNQCAK
jgi:hypothetical protein